MKRYYPDNLSPEDRLTYRRWTRNLYLFYFVVIAAAVALGSLSKHKGDLVASAGAGLPATVSASHFAKK